MKFVTLYIRSYLVGLIVLSFSVAGVGAVAADYCNGGLPYQQHSCENYVGTGISVRDVVLVTDYMSHCIYAQCIHGDSKPAPVPKQGTYTFIDLNEYLDPVLVPEIKPPSTIWKSVLDRIDQPIPLQV